MSNPVSAPRSTSQPIPKARIGMRTRKLLGDLATYAILIFGAIIMAGPFVWMIATAFKAACRSIHAHLDPESGDV